MSHLLGSIQQPSDLHRLSDEQLQQLAQEVREHIIDTVGEIGGHFGANLGACEIAVALHSLLDSPNDKILWDVGHQAYPHKILTGRRDELHTIRKYGGLAPFGSIGESEHDIMGAGHASTAIGYAVGIKEAMRRGEGPDAQVVAVVGDGALTGGVAFEAVHQAGGLGTPIVVLLNDNGMSIAPNVGALSRYFNRIRLNPKLWHAREDVEEGLIKLPAGIGAAFERLGPHVKESIKAFWAPGLWWEELDFAYIGVVDGHDVRIAEQQAILFAAGLALQGCKPVAAIYSTFLQRAYDQLVHDVCLQKLNVVLAMDRAGLVGDDGPTHHGAFDIAYLRCLPNIVLMAPRDEATLVHMLHTALMYDDGPVALRYPRGEALGVPLPSKPSVVPIGTGEILRE